MDKLDIEIREFSPDDGNWLALERHLERVFSCAEPQKYYDAIFNLFERFPEDDGAGVFWSALHGMEAIGGYETKLLQYFRRYPSLMTKTMLHRLLNSGRTHIEKIEIAKLIQP